MRVPNTNEKRMSFQLPTELNCPPEELWAYTTLVYGEKGIGKTSLAAQFPDHLVFQFEPRRRNLTIRQIWESQQKGAEGKPLDWPTFKEGVEHLVDNGPEKTGVRCVAIDTIDRSYQRCLEYICADAGIEHPNDANDYGKTWDKIKKEYERTLAELGQAGYGVILTSHAKEQRITPPMGDAFDQLTPTCPSAPFNVAKALCDFVFYYGYHGSTRVFTVRGTQAVFASCGVDNHFLNPQGKKLLTIDAGTTPEEAFNHLLSGYNNQSDGILWTPPASVLDSDDYEYAIETLAERDKQPQKTSVRKLSRQTANV